MDNLFEEIRNIEIGSSSYVESLNDMIRIINENFNRISGAPFLKGDRGNSVHTHKLEGTELATLKDAIYEELKRVYKEDPGTDSLTINGVGSSCTSIADLADSTRPSYITYISVFKDDVEGMMYIANPYIFLDARLNWVSENHYAGNNFIDKSCAITGVYTRGSWSISIHKIIPTLYYDDGIKQYCWMVNDNKTGIIAQGVVGAKGQDGRSLLLCKGNEPVNNQIEIISVYKEGDIGEVSGWITPTPNDDIEGQIALVLPNNISNTTSPKCVFGVIYEDGGVYKVPYDEDIDILRLVSEVKLKDLLDGVGTSNSVFELAL